MRGEEEEARTGPTYSGEVERAAAPFTCRGGTAAPQLPSLRGGNKTRGAEEVGRRFSRGHTANCTAIKMAKVNMKCRDGRAHNGGLRRVFVFSRRRKKQMLSLEGHTSFNLSHPFSSLPPPFT